ncbi:hypothetical protein NMY22_g18939 [Coprinellus aureogranulatus]|nr:hypothetical protein NMY22_g18939 [Coprinellus aureogranulatus]
MLPPFDIPTGSFTLITDELNAPADFLVYQAVFGYLKELPRSSSSSFRASTRRSGEVPGEGKAGVEGKEGKEGKERGEGTAEEEGKGNGKAKVLVLTANPDPAKWKSVSSKFGVNLPVHLASGVIRFVDVPSLCSGSYLPSHIDSSRHDSGNAGSRDSGGTKPGLGKVYDIVASSILTPKTQAPEDENEEERAKLVVLDDVSTLEWIGICSALDIVRFVRALRVLCNQTKATLLLRIHIPTSLPSELSTSAEFDGEGQRVKGAGGVGLLVGEIAIHPGPSTPPSSTTAVKLIKRSGSLQYRLLDTGPVYFEKGTSEGVL